MQWSVCSGVFAMVLQRSCSWALLAPVRLAPDSPAHTDLACCSLCHPAPPLLTMLRRRQEGRQGRACGGPEVHHGLLCEEMSWLLYEEMSLQWSVSALHSALHVNEPAGSRLVRAAASVRQHWQMQITDVMLTTCKMMHQECEGVQSMHTQKCRSAAAAPRGRATQSLLSSLPRASDRSPLLYHICSGAPSL